MSDEQFQKTYRIVTPRDVSGKKYHIAKFPTVKPPKFDRSIRISRIIPPPEPEPAAGSKPKRKKKPIDSFRIYDSKKDKSNVLYVGVPEKDDHSQYALLVEEGDQLTYHPIDFYRCQSQIHYETLSSDEAENLMNQRNRTLQMLITKHKNLKNVVGVMKKKMDEEIGGADEDNDEDADNSSSSRRVGRKRLDEDGGGEDVVLAGDALKLTDADEEPAGAANDPTNPAAAPDEDDGDRGVSHVREGEDLERDVDQEAEDFDYDPVFDDDDETHMTKEDQENEKKVSELEEPPQLEEDDEDELDDIGKEIKELQKKQDKKDVGEDESDYDSLSDMDSDEEEEAPEDSSVLGKRGREDDNKAAEDRAKKARIQENVGITDMEFRKVLINQKLSSKQLTILFQHKLVTTEQKTHFSELVRRLCVLRTDPVTKEKLFELKPIQES